MIEVKLTKQELEYIKLGLENDLDKRCYNERVEEDENEEEQKMVEDLYSKLVCLK